MSQNLHFHNTNTSLLITKTEEHKRARLILKEGVRLDPGARQKVEEGVRLALEASHTAEEEMQAQMKAEE